MRLRKTRLLLTTAAALGALAIAVISYAVWVEPNLLSNEKINRFAERLRGLGIKLLRNSSEPLYLGRNGEIVYIVGVEGRYLSRSKLDRLLETIPENAPVIMLSHHPDILENHTDALVVNLEEAEGKGVNGWGWQNDAYFEKNSSIVRFEKNGKHIIRVQRREDGVAVGEIRLVPLPPGILKERHHDYRPNDLETGKLLSSVGNSNIIVIGADKVPDSSIFGSWRKVFDETADINPVLKDESNSDEKVEYPLIEPKHYFEAGFYAEAGIDYYVSVKMKAENNQISNDSIYIQFDDSVNQKREPIFRLGRPGIRNGLTRVNLILAGHTHGGQVRLPITGALDNIPYHNIKYEMGMFQQNGTRMYVNRGIGTVLLPIRFLCLPEISIFHFK